MACTALPIAKDLTAVNVSVVCKHTCRTSLGLSDLLIYAEVRRETLVSIVAAWRRGRAQFIAAHDKAIDEFRDSAAGLRQEDCSEAEIASPEACVVRAKPDAETRSAHWDCNGRRMWLSGV